MISKFIAGGLIIISSLALSKQPAAAATVAGPFRLSLQTYPTNWDPRKVKASASQYLLPNLFRGLYKYHQDQTTPSPDLIESCKISLKTEAICYLKKSQKWSDGSDVSASDVQRSLIEVLKNPSEFKLSTQLKEVIADADLKNSITVHSPTEFRFKLTKSLSLKELEHRMTSMIWWPTKESLYSGAFQRQKSSSRSLIELIPNPFFPEPPRTKVQFLVVNDDSAVVKLFQNQQLDFVRRLPTQLIPLFAKNSDYKEFSILRFDYIGFSENLGHQNNLRKAISESLNYTSLQKLFSSKGRPGCFQGVGIIYPTPEICLPENNLEQKQNLKLNASGSLDEKSKKIFFYFNNLGAEDHVKLGEWLAAQLSPQIEILPRGLETALFEQQIKTKELFLYRKGFTPESLSCEDIQNQFIAEILPQNELMKELRSQKTCFHFFKKLSEMNLMIPTGSYSQTVLVRSLFKGLKINILNQLDLSRVQTIP